MGGTYGYPQFLLAERGRALLGYLQLLTGGLCFMMGILIIAFGFTTRIVIGSYTSVLEEYNNSSFVTVYIISGLIQAGINLAVTYKYKLASRSRTRTSGATSPLFQLWRGVIILTPLLLLITGITVGIQLNKIDKALGVGFGGLMGVYIAGDSKKMAMDRIQIDFQCCGSRGPEDWFTIAWKKNEYLLEKDLTRMRKAEVYHVADAPFSCCDSESTVTPCQHDDINNVAVHGTIFDTLYEDGCQVAMLDYFKQALLLPAIVFLTCIIIMQMINLIVMRFLATSVDNLSWASPDDVDGVSPGYLISTR